MTIDHATVTKLRSFLQSVVIHLDASSNLPAFRGTAYSLLQDMETLVNHNGMVVLHTQSGTFDLPYGIYNEALELIKMQKRIQAIRLIREDFRVGLLQAKHIMDEIANMNPTYPELPSTN